MRKLRILVDMDEVQCHFVKRIVEWYNRDFGTNFRSEDIRTFKVQDDLGPGTEHVMRSYMRYARFFDDLEPIEGAVEGMKTLHEAGHKICIATAIPKFAGQAYEGKTQWVRKHLPFFDLKNFYPVDEKFNVRGDVLFDDGAHNLEAWVKDGGPEGRGGIAVAMDRPWNSHLGGLVLRVRTWPEFVRMVADLSESCEKAGWSFCIPEGT